MKTVLDFNYILKYFILVRMCDWRMSGLDFKIIRKTLPVAHWNLSIYDTFSSTVGTFVLHDATSCINKRYDKSYLVAAYTVTYTLLWTHDFR